MKATGGFTLKKVHLVQHPGMYNFICLKVVIIIKIVQSREKMHQHKYTIVDKDHHKKATHLHNTPSDLVLCVYACALLSVCKCYLHRNNHL